MERQPLTDKQQIVYEAIQEELLVNWFTAGIFGAKPKNIAEQLGYNESAYIYGGITALVKKGYIEKVPNTKGKNTLYTLTQPSTNIKINERPEKSEMSSK